jgi:hypothetical protein
MKSVYLSESVNRDEITFLQYQLYNEIFNRYANEVSLDGIMYFKTIPAVCLLRSRLTQCDYSISLERVGTFDEAYERWLNCISAVPQIKINGERYNSDISQIISFLDFRL